MRLFSLLASVLAVVAFGGSVFGQSGGNGTENGPGPTYVKASTLHFHLTWGWHQYQSGQDNGFNGVWRSVQTTSSEFKFTGPYAFEGDYSSYRIVYTLIYAGWVYEYGVIGMEGAPLSGTWSSPAFPNAPWVGPIDFEVQVQAWNGSYWQNEGGPENYEIYYLNNQ